MNVGDPGGSSKKEVFSNKRKSEELEKALSQEVRRFIVVMKQSNSCGAKEPGQDCPLKGNVKSQ